MRLLALANQESNGYRACLDTFVRRGAENHFTEAIILDFATDVGVIDSIVHRKEIANQPLHECPQMVCDQPLALQKVRDDIVVDANQMLYQERTPKVALMVLIKNSMY